MKNIRNAVARAMAVSVVVTGIVACEKREMDEEKGPAEKAGHKLAQAARRAGEELNKAAEKAGQGLQQLGQKIQNESKEAQESAKKE